MGAVETAVAALGLRVENVTLQFAGLRALDDVSFEIRPDASPR